MPVNTMHTASTLGLVGAKGGVGTTALACNLAWALAQRYQRVVLLDLDVRTGQAALHLCERNAGPTVHEALQVIERLDSTLLDTLLTPCSPTLRLLPAPRNWWAWPEEPDRNAEGLLKLVRTASELADWVLVDLPKGAMTHEGLAPLMQHLQEVALVTEPTLPATFNARWAWQWLQEQRGPSRTHSLVLNKMHKACTVPGHQLRRTLGLGDDDTAWRELPRSDAAVAQASYQGQAVGALTPKDPWARGVSQWAAELAARRTAQFANTAEHTSDAVGPNTASDEGPAGAAPTGQPASTLAPPLWGRGAWRERLMRWAT